MDSMVTSAGGTFTTSMVKADQRFDIKSLKPNTCYMVSLALYCGLSSQLLAPALASTGAVWEALQYQVDAPQFFQNNKILDPKTCTSSSSVIGIAIGSIIGGVLVGKGRRINIMIFNIVAILGSAMSTISNFWVLLAGRFIFGFSSGVLLCATPKMIEETIPAHLQDYGFATSTNMIINCSIAVSMIMGIGMPSDEDDLKTTNYWKIMYLFPVPFCLITLFLSAFIFRHDSVNFHVERGQKPQAMAMLRKLYPDQEDSTIEKVLVELQTQLTTPSDSESPGMAQALCDKEYRVATWVVLFIALANQMSGINILNIYAETIFIDVKNQGGAASFSPKGCTYFTGMSGFIGAFLANFTVYFLSRRQVFLIGHACMGVFLLGVAVFIVEAEGNLVLLSMCFFVISLQSSNGSAFWVYAAEVCCDAAMGVCLFVLWGILVIQSLLAETLIDLLSIQGLFYGLAGFQVVTCLVLFCVMKESKGLSAEEKKKLYKRT